MCATLALKDLTDRTIGFACSYGPEVGMGHVVRCARLAREFSSRGFNTCLITPDNKPLGEKLQDSFDETIRTDARLLRTTFKDTYLRLDAIVIDHYGYTGQEFELLRKQLDCMVWIFDSGSRTGFLGVDAVINILPEANQHTYSKRVLPSTIMLLGPRYAVLDESFSISEQEVVCEQSDLLVCLGGGCDKGHMKELIDAILCMALPRLRITVAMSSQSMSADYIAELSCDSQGSIRLALDCKEMASLIRQSRLCLVSAGTLAYECIALSKPTLLITRASNQIPVANGFDSMGAAKYIGALGEISYRFLESVLLESLEARAFVGARTVPLNGATAIVDRLLEHCEVTRA